jgi:hypothetical protein
VLPIVGIIGPERLRPGDCLKVLCDSPGGGRAHGGSPNACDGLVAGVEVFDSATGVTAAAHPPDPGAPEGLHPPDPGVPVGATAGQIASLTAVAEGDPAGIQPCIYVGIEASDGTVLAEATVDLGEHGPTGATIAFDLGGLDLAPAERAGIIPCIKIIGPDRGIIGPDRPALGTVDAIGTFEILDAATGRTTLLSTTSPGHFVSPNAPGN